MDDMLTITPPLPPSRVDMRRTASCAARKAPTVLTARIRCRRSGPISTNLAAFSTMPALLKNASSRPSSASTVLNRRTMSSGLATSAGMAMALRPAFRMSATTASAAALLLA
jgi:hypothetical protein